MFFMKAIDRLFQYFENKEIKPTRLEKEIGLSNGYFGGMRKRNADIGESVLGKILDYFRDISPDWLLSGRGPMLRDERPAPEPNLATEPYDEDYDEGLEILRLEMVIDQSKKEYELETVRLKAEHRHDISLYKELLSGKDEEIKKLNREIGAMEEKLSARTQTAPIGSVGLGVGSVPIADYPSSSTTRHPRK
jgi:hypothetical protein